MAEEIKEQLPEYYIEGEPITKEVLGSGAFAVVKKIVLDETECAAKIIHGAISYSSEVGSQYVRELSVQSNLRHPNITQFLGICRLPDSTLPALVTELMDTNLHKFLENPDLQDRIPLSDKKSILEDVTKGLIYLHKKGIVHRDLTANNVLLTTSLIAKIADLGNSRFLPNEEFAELTSRPGTLVYMPPEAYTPDYEHKLDIFSFGHLTLFTIIQVFPAKLPHPTYQDPTVQTESLKPLNEVERRAVYFEMMKNKLPDDVHDAFTDLMKQCLAYAPESRPEAIGILRRLKQIPIVGRNHRNEGINNIEADLLKEKEVEEEKQKIKSEFEETIHRMEHAMEQKDKEILSLREKLRALQTHDLTSVGLSCGVPKLTPVQIAQSSNLTPPQGDSIYGEGTWDGAATLASANNPQLLSNINKPQVPPQPTVVPKQRRVPPIKMSNYPQAVVLNDRIYMGGGFTRTEDIAKVLEFDPQQEIWKDLAKCPTKYFGMVVVKKELLIIGGTDLSNNTKTGHVYSFNFDSKEWNSFKCTSMLTFRSMPSVVSYDDKWLIALGGEDKNGQVLSSVEKLNVENPEDKCHWSRCPNLPVKCAHFSSTVIGNKLFTFGTTTYRATMSVGMPSNSVFYAPLEELILAKCDAYASWEEIQLPPAPPTPSVSLWQELHHLPLKASTAVSFEGSLFALGGTEKSYAGASTSIFKLEYTENPDDKRIQNAEWKKVGDLPIALCQCACVQNGNCIFVHGRRMKVADVCVYTLTIINSV